MRCLQPQHGWLGPNPKQVVYGGPNYYPGPGWHYVPLGCGKCQPCRTNYTMGLALRCKLELHQHSAACATVLTYDDKHLPPTLEIRAYQLFVKRLRKALNYGQLRPAGASPIKYFLSGEYGETFQRPHFHAIIFGLSLRQHDAYIQEAWKDNQGRPLGFAHPMPVNDATINYIAGYTAKKLGDTEARKHERVDPTTGEVYHWQPPFTKWSKGLAEYAKTQYPKSWRSYAINNGHKMAVPRYLHEGYKKQASDTELQKLKEEKIQQLKQNITTTYELEANAIISQAQLKERQQKRTKL